MRNGNEIKIIHLMSDDKFIDASITLFESNNECNNIYFVYLPKRKITPTYVKSSKIIIIHDDDDIFKILSTSEKINGIIIHYYDWKKAKGLITLTKMYPSVKVFWFAWGGDFYSEINYPLFGKETKQLLLKKHWKSLVITTSGLKSIFKYDCRFWKLAIPLIDYCSPVLPNEYDYLLKIKGFRAQQVLYSYFDSGLIDFLSNTVQNIQIANNVLIGNSATPSNNHLDIFQRIKGEVKQGKIIIPLSYGELWYRNEIIKKGELLFRESFYPIVDFMRKEDYYNLISSCSIAIFNHYRQQAIGNSHVMLYFGARVYLSEKSIAYQYYKALGVHVYSLEKDFEKYKFLQLEVEKVIENREKMINNIFNKKKLTNILCDIIQILKN